MREKWELQGKHKEDDRNDEGLKKKKGKGEKKRTGEWVRWGDLRQLKHGYREAKRWRIRVSLNNVEAHVTIHNLPAVGSYLSQLLSASLEFNVTLGSVDAAHAL